MKNLLKLLKLVYKMIITNRQRQANAVVARSIIVLPKK